MDFRAIHQNQVPHTSKLFQDFLYEPSRVGEFYRFPPFEPESFLESAQGITYPESLRGAVVSVLREQNEKHGSGDETIRNLDRLAKPGCCAVVTGQQVGLFSGPAFTIYKALTAIKLARTLTERGKEAVPVFWLATEDHDLEEVNHCFVQDREGKPARLHYSDLPQIANAPVGEISFSDAIGPLVESVRTALPESPDADHLVDLIQHSYRRGARFGDAFGDLLSKLFARWGVVLVEPLDI